MLTKQLFGKKIELVINGLQGYPGPHPGTRECDLYLAKETTHVIELRILR